MKILVLSDEVWNDKINGNNITSNWFENMDAEFANIYASPGKPYNKCCKKYFQITDIMMFKSILSNKGAGNIVTNYESDNSIIQEEPKKLYKFLKNISGDFLRLIRELIWLLGKYNDKELKKFIDEFNPDVIFSERMATCKMLRLERKITKYCKAPMFAFTGDDEFSLKQISFSPFFWIRRLMVRKMLRKNVKTYKIYYTLSLEQKKYYKKIFGCNSKILQKCGEFEHEYSIKKTNNPIKLIYAGKFYCNRWKVLSEIAKAISEINKDETKMILEIYTKEIPTKRQNKLLNDGKNSFIVGAVSQEELKQIYQNSDIALHVESRDIKNRLLTRFSFSTKIIDCIFSGCAVMAYCWNKQSGWTYLKRENAGICVSSYQELKNELKKLCEDKNQINDYAYKAYLCGNEKHNRIKIQKMLKEDFSKYII